MTFELPQMFQFPLQFRNDGFDDFEGLQDIGGIPMQKNAPVVGHEFNEIFGQWPLPDPEIVDDDHYATASSQAEIVQKIFLAPRDYDCMQFELFFAQKDATAIRSTYGHARLAPTTATTLFELRKKAVNLGLQEIVQKFMPIGFFFNFIDCQSNGRNGFMAAYSCGGLCDVLNVWQTQLVPGMRLFILLIKMEKEGSPLIVPYAGYTHPKEDTAIKNLCKNDEWALLDIGTVCVGTNKAPIQYGTPYIRNNKENTPASGVGTVPDTTDAARLQGHVLRVNVPMLRWEYIPSDA